MKADEAMSQSNPSSTTGKEAVMDTAPAVNVAVEAQSQSHPKDPSGEEATMVATPAVDAVEAQSLSNPKDPSGKEATMVAESQVVSPSSTSTPSESPKKGGKGKRAFKHKKEGRPAFEKNRSISRRLKNSGYETQISAMFLKSVSASEKASHALSELAYEHDLTERSLSQAAIDAMQRLGRLLVLCKYLSVDVDLLLERARLTLAQVKTRKPTQAIDAAHQLARHITSMSATPPPDELLRDAKQLLHVARAGVACLDASEAESAQLAVMRQALARVVKKGTDDLALLTAELRHTDACNGTNWFEHVLQGVAPTLRGVEAPESQVSNDPTALKEAKGATG